MGRLIFDFEIGRLYVAYWKGWWGLGGWRHPEGWWTHIGPLEIGWGLET